MTLEELIKEQVKEKEAVVLVIAKKEFKQPFDSLSREDKRTCKSMAEDIIII